jgi:prevent-host-death family protein
MAQTKMTEVGIKKLKDHLSSYLKLVRQGQSITITDRGKPIAQIIPKVTSIDDRMGQLLEAGVIEWNGENLPRIKPVVKNPGEKLVSDIITEMRE